VSETVTYDKNKLLKDQIK